MQPIRNIPLSEFLKADAFQGSYIPLTHVGFKTGNIEKIIHKAKQMLQTEGSMTLYINDHVFRFDAAKREGFLLELFDQLKDMCELIELVSADRDCTYAKLKLHPHIKKTDSDEVYEVPTVEETPTEEEIELSQRTDFNGNVLEVGDEVIHIHGRLLRQGTIERIEPYQKGRGDVTPIRIFLVDIKVAIYSHCIIKQ